MTMAYCNIFCDFFNRQNNFFRRKSIHGGFESGKMRKKQNPNLTYNLNVRQPP